jgi:hypothetical protein
MSEIAAAAFNQRTWDEWQARGRAADAAFAARVRVLALVAAAVVAIAAAFWTLA